MPAALAKENGFIEPGRQGEMSVSKHLKEYIKTAGGKNY